jgi:hypothetical protein
MAILDSYNMTAERTWLISIPIAPLGPSRSWDARIHFGYNRHTANLVTSIRSHVNCCQYDVGTEVWDSIEQMNVVRKRYSGNCAQHRGVIMPIWRRITQECGLPLMRKWDRIRQKTWMMLCCVLCTLGSHRTRVLPHVYEHYRNKPTKEETLQRQHRRTTDRDCYLHTSC